VSFSSKPLTTDHAKEAKNRIAAVDTIFAEGIELEFLSTIQLYSYATEEKLGSVKKIEFFNKHAKQLTWLTEDLEKLHMALLLAASTDMVLKYQIEKALGFGYIMLREVEKGFPFLQSAASFLISNPPKPKAERIIKKDICALVAKIYETKKILPAANYFYNQAFDSVKRKDMFEANEFMLGALRTTIKEKGITAENYHDLKNLCKKIIKNGETDLESEKTIDNDMKEQQAESKDVSLTSMAATFHVKDETFQLIENQKKSAEQFLARIRKAANDFPKQPTIVKHIADKLGGKTFIGSPLPKPTAATGNSSPSTPLPHGIHKPKSK
jgi:hypothetical protein